MFLWAPHVGLPAPRRGWWLSCWAAQGTGRCHLTDIDGRTLFEGDCLPYGRRHLLSEGELRINGPKTEAGEKVWVDDAPVPLIHIQDGTILIPVAAYERGRQILERQNR